MSHPTPSDSVTDFLDAMKSAGVIMDCAGIHPICDGRLHRADAMGKKVKRNNHVWYVFHADSPASGAFGDLALGINETWTAKRPNTMTDEEREAIKRRVVDTQRERAADMARVNAEAATAGLAIWKAAVKATADHPYLAAKVLPVFPGLKMLTADVNYTIDGEAKKARKGNLVVAIMTPANELASVQLITPTGDKLFLKGTAKKGNYSSVGKITDTIIIAEGYATGARIHQATGLCVIVAFDSGNVLPVALAIRKKYPDADIVIACDNDRFTKKPDGTPTNPGVEAGRAAAEKIGALLAIPAFADDDLKSSDFDDLAQLDGLDAVKVAMEGARGPNVVDLKPRKASEGPDEPPPHDSMPDGPEQGDWDVPPSGRLITHDSLAVELGLQDWDLNARFVPVWNDWLFWEDETRWVRASYVVARGRIREFLRQKADRIARDADVEASGMAAGKAESLQRSTDKQCRELGMQQTHTSVEQMARSNPSSAAKPGDFDAKPLLLGTPGGTVDLRTGELRAARRDDLITKFTAVTPASDGCPEIWLDFFRRVFPGPDGRGDAEMIAFFQRAAGYALTGETSEQKLLFLHGTGRNGKGTIVQTLTSILGDYAKAVSSSLFVQQHGEAHPTGLAQLNGPRFVSSNEIPKNATWNEEIIKSLTGGDTISARYMRQDFFEFRTQLTLFISGNNLPRFKGVGLSMRERFLLVPFKQNFTDENGQRDPRLGEKLKAEWPAILRWCIDGAIAWQRQGLNPPDQVKEASAEYLDEEDDVAEFIRDYLVADPTARTAMSDIYPLFKDYQLMTKGLQHAWSQNAMTRALGEEGNLHLKQARPTSGAVSSSKCVMGYALKRRPQAHWGGENSYGNL